MRWGLVTTTNAPTKTVLDFAAYHLDQGAARLWLFLDAPNPELAELLSKHRQIKVVETDDAYWAKKGRRPDMHQPRQAVNARHAYNRSKRLGWLAHIDVDEFLWPETRVADHLSTLPDTCHVARMRPVEALAPDPAHPQETHYYKATPIDRKARAAVTAQLYPDYAGLIDDGFLSHVAGKIFVRCGLQQVKIKIHNATVADVENPGQQELPAISLCHRHAEDWQTWRERFDYRLERGAYRSSLGRKGPSGLTLHEVFVALRDHGGEHALKAFHTALCTATPMHLAALERAGMLHERPLDLVQKRQRYFPDVTD
ncbi:glycosyltransferase family 2 protein [Pseudaestuariivita sp.]|uniref:glycosyltransferase family 2 protein n=1 Tax=Pseudaestuariivita sp. TaxID=2211669 RepID=UPI0040581F72